MLDAGIKILLIFYKYAKSSDAGLSDQVSYQLYKSFMYKTSSQIISNSKVKNPINMATLPPKTDAFAQHLTHVCLQV